MSAPIAGRLLPRLGQRVLVGGLVLFAVGVAAAALVAARLAGAVGAGGVALLLAPAAAGRRARRRQSVITPNQALSLADVDVRGGSTAGGVLQTAQRIGNAVGAAVITRGLLRRGQRCRGRRRPSGRPTTGTPTR